MQWLDETGDPPPSSRRGPPRLPGLPDIPPMPVAAPEAPVPTNKTIEVEPQWLEQVEERRAAKKAAAAAPAPRPRIRPIPREDK